MNSAGSLYQSLRSVAGIDNSDYRNLIEIVGSRRELRSLFKELDGNHIIALSNANISEDGDIEKGKMWYGLFNNIEFHNEYGRKNKGKHGLVWFGKKAYIPALGLSEVYDIAIAESIKNLRGKIGPEDLKIFKFFGHNGNTDEYANIVDIDAFLAYNSFMQKKFGHRETNSHYLGRVEKFEPGAVFHHTVYNSPSFDD